MPLSHYPPMVIDDLFRECDPFGLDGFLERLSEFNITQDPKVGLKTYGVETIQLFRGGSCKLPKWLVVEELQISEYFSFPNFFNLC